MLKVDLEKCTATHSDGWVFVFTKDDDGLGGECVSQPSPLKIDQLKSAAKIAREAGEVYVEAKRKIH